IPGLPFAIPAVLSLCGTLFSRSLHHALRPAAGERPVDRERDEEGIARLFPGPTQRTPTLLDARGEVRDLGGPGIVFLDRKQFRTARSRREAKGTRDTPPDIAAVSGRARSEAVLQDTALAEHADSRGEGVGTRHDQAPLRDGFGPVILEEREDMPRAPPFRRTRAGEDLLGSAEQPVHLVEVVNEKVNRRSARLGRVAHPVIPVR